MKLELLADAVLIEMQDLDATCERAIKLMSLHQKLEGLRGGRIMLYGKHESAHLCLDRGQRFCEEVAACTVEEYQKPRQKVNLI